MKKQYISDIRATAKGKKVELYGWLKSKRKHGKLVFLDICDSTGTIQVVVERYKVDDLVFNLAKTISLESSLVVEGITGDGEINCQNIKLIGEAKGFSPNPRSEIDIFDEGSADHLLRNRHLYIRNDKVMAILYFRHILMGLFHKWFREQGYIEITAPLLTAMPLYQNASVIPAALPDQEAYLTQCVAFYLEAAVHAFEKVYNIGPSFRGEESRSKRHLMEYWHIKAEMAFGDFEDIITHVENFLRFLSIQSKIGADKAKINDRLNTVFCDDCDIIPYPRISYRDAISLLQKKKTNINFGESLSTKEEELLSKNFNGPFWVTDIPRSIEPFPYRIDPNDQEVTLTADLIASKGYGELLGVAEKISDINELEERMKEKGKLNDSRYNWLKQLRKFGSVPHIGFGMGVERYIRYLLQIPHVRDAIPFPRTFRRKIYP